MRTLPQPLGEWSVEWASQNNRLLQQELLRLDNVEGRVSTLESVTYTASRAIVSDASGLLTASATTATEIGHVSGVTSAIQTQLNAKQPIDATLTALAGANWAANSMFIGSGADTGAQVTFAANTIPGRSSTGGLVAKTCSDAAFSFLATGALGTPSSGTLANCTGLPISTGVSGLGANIAAWLADPTSANLAAAVTGETGSGALVFATSCVINPTSIGATTPGSGAFTTLSATGTITAGDRTTTVQTNTLGAASGTNGGASVNVANGANTIIAIGNQSNITGGAYNATPMLWANATIHVAVGLSITGNVGTTTLAIQQGAIISGTWTPTITGVTNVATTTAVTCQYMRVGAVVTCSGAMLVDPTSGSTLTELRISLPIASTLSFYQYLSGTGSFEFNYEPVRIIADTTNNQAFFQFVPLNSAEQILSFHFTYRIA